MQTLRRPKIRDQATPQIKQSIVDHLAEGRVDAALAEMREHLDSHQERSSCSADSFC